ncbi:hypothetical protein WDM22_26410 [Bradyrhizobium septentrionale]|uniref:hypothetical protein n=1 Tax=Bradyrhizobium septentrionale TaxID=1404411 RepID=UPI0030D35471
MTGKKRSAKPSVRARKRGVAPPSPTRRSEIVEEILHHLHPLKAKNSTAAVAAKVNQALDGHLQHALQQAKVSTRTQIQEHAKQLDLALMKVEALLRSAPGAVIWSLHYLAAPVRTKPERAEDSERAIWKRAEDFAAELGQMRQRCARMGDTGFERHPNYDDTKHACAWGAHGLMEGSSNAKISGTQDGAFRAIASLLYEAISGQRDVDLKRACDSVLRDMRGEN